MFLWLAVIQRTHNPAQGWRYQRRSLLADLRTVLSLDLVIRLVYGTVYWAGFILQLRKRRTVFNFSAVPGSGSTSEPPRLVKDAWARTLEQGRRSLSRGAWTRAGWLKDSQRTTSGPLLSFGNSLNTWCVQPWTGQNNNHFEWSV